MGTREKLYWLIAGCLFMAIVFITIIFNYGIQTVPTSRTNVEGKIYVFDKFEGKTETPVDNFQVILISETESDFRFSKLTNKKGKFKFKNIPPGSYHLLIPCKSFLSEELDSTIRKNIIVPVVSRRIDLGEFYVFQ
jgi:hypothetical protein